MEKICRNAISGHEEGLPLTCTTILGCQPRLATILELRGKYNAVQKLLITEVSGQSAAFDPKNPKTLKNRYRLPYLQYAQGHYEAAELVA